MPKFYVNIKMSAYYTAEVNAENIEAAKKEVTKRNGGKYTCPLPDSVLPPLDTY
jgi:hypothetical protein